MSLSQGLRTLQYYSVGVGKDPERGGYAVSGGLQDNGGSLLRGDGKDNAGNSEMVSPFGVTAATSSSTRRTAARSWTSTST